MSKYTKKELKTILKNATEKEAGKAKEILRRGKQILLAPIAYPIGQLAKRQSDDIIKSLRLHDPALLDELADYERIEKALNRLRPDALRGLAAYGAIGGLGYGGYRGAKALKKENHYTEKEAAGLKEILKGVGGAAKNIAKAPGRVGKNVKELLKQKGVVKSTLPEAEALKEIQWLQQQLPIAQREMDAVRKALGHANPAMEQMYNKRIKQFQNLVMDVPRREQALAAIPGLKQDIAIDALKSLGLVGGVGGLGYGGYRLLSGNNEEEKTSSMRSGISRMAYRHVYGVR